MSKTENYEKILNWLDKEKEKDKIQLEKSKADIVNQLKGMSKETLFIKQKTKLTLWQKIRKTIWGL
jgi:hypothetical protein